jgi:hypothetical protein
MISLLRKDTYHSLVSRDCQWTHEGHSIPLLLMQVSLDRNDSKRQSRQRLWKKTNTNVRGSPKATMKSSGQNQAISETSGTNTYAEQQGIIDLPFE